MATTVSPQSFGCRGIAARVCLPQRIEVQTVGLADRHYGRSVAAATAPCLAIVFFHGFLRPGRRSVRRLPDEDYRTHVVGTASFKPKCASVVLFAGDIPFGVEPVEGKGLGAVAVRDIAAGELVVSESPVIALKGDAFWKASMQQQFDVLPDSKQQALLALSDVQLIGGQQKTLEGIVVTNNIGCNSPRYDCVVCEAISRLNHSCVPNCEQTWDEETSTERIYASRDIKIGEEMCFSYVDPFLPRLTRLEYLRQSFRFECMCTACGHSDDESDKRRARLGEIFQRIQSVGSDADEGVNLTKEMLDLCDHEGLSMNAFRVQACYHAFQCLVRAKRFEEAQPWIERTVGYCEMCRGPDHADTELMRGYAKDPRSHPAAADEDMFSSIRNALFG